MEVPRDPAASRYDHVGKGLRRSDLDPDPIRQFANWFTAAIEAGIRDVNAMSLATAGPDARPSVRIVLLKSFDQDELRLFYQLREHERKTARGESVRRAWVLLDRTGPANSHQRKSREDFARRIAELFSFASSRKPIECLGVASKRSHRRAARARCADGGDDRALSKQTDSIAAALGRLPAETGYGRILARAAKSAARSLSVHATGGR